MIRNAMQGSRASTRREFITTTSAAVAVLSSQSLLSASAASPTSKYRRVNVESKEAEPHLRSYEKAVTAMLALPFSDARNWYRHALIHTLDCPHGNWWFLPWHRGYTGWLERICRELSGDPDFALPYWDWTQKPKLPERFWEGNLNPENFKITGFADFKSKMKVAVSDFWGKLLPLQRTQLSLRDYAAEDLLWANIQKPDPNSEYSMFSDISYVRELNPPRSPWLNEIAASAVAIDTIKDALSAQTFESFGSHKIGYHSGFKDNNQGVLEAQPHNQVHNATGGFLAGPPDRAGFMSDFLSPTDPIFFMHHANIDRLWDVWTRKQLAAGGPIVPTDPDELRLWNSEPFAFFVDHSGNPVHQQTSGDYVSTDFFAYEYEPGTGEGLVKKPAALITALSAAANRRVATVLPQRASALNQATAMAKAPAALSLAAAKAGDVRVVAQITAELPPDSRNLRLHVLVNTPTAAQSVGFTSPNYAGTYQQFGSHVGTGHDTRVVTFSIGLTKAIERLTAAEQFDAAGDMKVTVVADWPGVSLSAPIKVTHVEILAQ